MLDDVEILGLFSLYFRWQMMANRLTMTAHPVLVTPAGFTDSGLPVGMQVVGAHHREAALLSIGAAIEATTGHVGRRPAAFG